MKDSTRTPAAHTSGPSVIGRRGPVCSATTAIRADSSNSRMVTGSVATPDASGENPALVCSCSTTKNISDPSAP